jgi:deoxyribodipyrimidine photo-lyase
MGSAQRWWLHETLDALGKEFEQRGSRLILRRGDSVAALTQLGGEIGAESVHAIRHHEPWWVSAESELDQRLDVHLHEGNTLAPVGAIRSASGELFKRFTPFWRALSSVMPPPYPEPAPDRIAGPDRWPASDRLESWRLQPQRPNWARAFEKTWTPGERDARERLAAFEERVAFYKRRRDFPSDEGGTSWLSPHLHFGEISPSAIWHALDGHHASSFLRELAWRDFAKQMVLADPDLGDVNGRSEFDVLPWRVGAKADDDFRAWTQGRTGYPIVDAGMRQLWSIGWMHNRVRMIAASFLVKHLLIDWRNGERWFWDTLVDADYANNSLNWQWVAGTGVDASPFFRIMAPLLQSEKFDAADYIRRWVPELTNVQGDAVHDPQRSNEYGGEYAPMIVEHREGRERALSAWRALRAAGD